MTAGRSRIAISRQHAPVRALGYGERAGIWVQGCSVGCSGCISRDTWVPQEHHQTEVDDVLAWVSDRLDHLDGVTVSGGEPFDQPEALGHLLEGLHLLRRRLPQAVDFLCFSGYPLSRLRRVHPRLLDLLDVVVSGPYVRRRAALLPLRGSSNQRVTPLTPLGEQRYAGLDAADAGVRPRMQVASSGDTLWYIGIPAPGDMERLDAMLRERGVEQGVVSWQA